MRLRDADSHCRNALPGALLRGGLMLLLLALMPLQAPLAAPTGEGVGRIVFAIGRVQVETDGSTRTVARGARVYEGDRVITGPAANAQIRFSDGGFLGLRPESAVRIRVYRPGGEDAEQVRIRLDVERGTVRSVTGRGGARDRDGFRLNTPVAAVGVRGTDFTVRSNQRVTRVQVHEGGVAVSPFTSRCARDGFGACAGEAARTLFARDAGQRAIEVLRGADHARFVRRDRAAIGADGAVDGPGEAAAGAANDDGNDDRKRASPDGQGAPRDRDDADAALDADSAISEIDENRSAGSTIEQAARRSRFEAVRDDITWGRWARVAGEHATVTDKRRADQVPVALNRVFGLLAPRWRRWPDIGLPDAGVVAFHPGSSEAVLVDQGETVPANVANPELTVDFARRRFTTRLDVEAERLDGAARIRAEGRVDPTGQMRTDASESNARVNGIVGPGGRQAGMLFQRALDEGVTAAGAIDWFR